MIFGYVENEDPAVHPMLIHHAAAYRNARYYAVPGVSPPQPGCDSIQMYSAVAD